MRESFVFYSSYYEALAEFDETIQLHLFKAICEYALYEKIPELSGTEKALFTLIKPTVDSNEKRYNNGKKGGRPKKTSGYENEKPTVINSETDGYENEKPNVNVNDNVTVNDTVNVNEDNHSDKSESKPKKPPKHKFGEYGHVRLTDDEYQKLCDDYGKETADLYITKCDEYCETKPKTYGNYNLAIRNTFMKRDNIVKRSDDYESVFRSPDPNDAAF